MQRLFVYGTLAPGRVNHRILEAIPGSWRAATLTGKLVNKGWGSELGYPGIVPSEEGEEVAGYIFSSEQLSQHWPMLDQFEGEAYQRISVTVRVESGEKVEAYVYALDHTH